MNLDGTTLEKENKYDQTYHHPLSSSTVLTILTENMTASIRHSVGLPSA